MAKDDWQTPKELFDKLNDEFHFGTDVACNDQNRLCSFHYNNSLIPDWFVCPYGPFWMNPPYSKPNLDLFTKKAYEESQKGCTVVGLLPCDCSTGWFKKYVMKAHEIRFLSRRVQFIDPDTGKRGKNGPTFGSIIVVWKPGHVDAPEVSSYEW